MRRTAARVNRVWLGVTGVLLLLAGLLAGLVALGLAASIARAAGTTWSGPDPGAKAVPTAAGTFLAGSSGPVALGLVGLVLAVLGLLWLLRQVPRSHAAKPFRLHDEVGTGFTVCEPAVLARAVEAEVEALPGVSKASAVVRGTAAQPILALRVTAHEQTALQPLLQTLQTEVAGHLAAALEAPLHELGVRLEINRERRSSDSVTFAAS